VTRGPRRTLTADEVVLVQKWARRNRFVLWLLLPFVAVTIIGLAAAGISSVSDGDWLFGGTFVLLSPLVALVVFVTWRSMRTYGVVHTTTPVETRRGVLHHKRIGKSFVLAIGNVSVAFVNRGVRRSVKLGEPIIAEVVMGAPVLVITARPDPKT
jgi:hypothetical protein